MTKKANTVPNEDEQKTGGNAEDEEYFMDEDHARSASGSLRQETELFDDEKYIPHDLISAKHVSLPKGGEDWQIQKNKKTVLVLKGVRFTSKEKNYFRTPTGMKFLIDGYKNGWNSVSEFKRQVKKCL